MCTAIVAFLIKRKLWIKGLKGPKNAAAASTGFIWSQETAGSSLLLGAAKKRLIALSGSEDPTPDLARQRATGHRDFQQDVPETQL